MTGPRHREPGRSPEAVPREAGPGEKGVTDTLDVDFTRSRRGRMFRSPRGAITTSTLSTLAVLAAIVVAFLLAPGSRAVRATYFNGPNMWQAFVGDPHEGFYSVGKAIVVNIEMFAIGEVLILVLALVIALIRQSTSPVLFPLRMLAIAFVDFFRGVPLILVILAIGFGLVTASVLAVSGVGLSLQFGVTNFVNFAYGDYATLGAYIALLLNAHGMSVYLAMVIAALGVAVFAVIVNRYLFRPFLDKRVPLLTLLIVSLGLSLIIQNGIQSIWGPNFQTYNVAQQTSLAIGPLLLTVQQIIIIGVAAASRDGEPTSSSSSSVSLTRPTDRPRPTRAGCADGSTSP